MVSLFMANLRPISLAHHPLLEILMATELMIFWLAPLEALFPAKVKEQAI